ncbi:hypothetical protein Hanom_Chr04g00341051 [Helianthus anomalus]
MSFPENATRIEPESSSGLQFNVGGSSSSDSDDDVDVDVLKLQKRVVALEQDYFLKDAQISSLQDRVSNKNQTINQLQSDVNLLMSMVFDLKAKLEKKFGREFAGEDDDPMNVEQRDRTTEERAAEIATEKQSNKQMLIMKNQDVNPLDGNFQPKDPTKTSDHYVMEPRSHYGKVRNKLGITSWRYDHKKQMWLVIRESGHQEYYSKVSQFESWMMIDLKNSLRAPYHDSDPNQHGRGWAFLSKLEREVKNDFPNMKCAQSSVKKNRGVRDPYTGRTVKL